MNGNTWYPLDFKFNQKKRNLDKLIQKSPVMEFIFQSYCLQVCNFTKNVPSRQLRIQS